MFREFQQIGAYILIRKLGQGGFGEVWLAEKRSGILTKMVAIKLPHGEQINLEAIRQEAALWEQVSRHENVLTIFDADIYDGQAAIVSEYAEDGSLADKLQAEGRLPVDQAVEMTIGILKGLAHLHSKNIVHRDIKPANILLQGTTPRLADFGISRAMNTSNISSVIIGTDSYMAPEALDGVRNVQTDVWSVGVVLYQLLRGSLPFPQEHYSERMFAILTKDFAPLPADIPPELRSIVGYALAKNPQNRYPSAESMARALENFLVYSRNPAAASPQFHTDRAAPLSTPLETQDNPTVVTKISSAPPPEIPPTRFAAPLDAAARQFTDHNFRPLQTGSAGAVIDPAQPLIKRYSPRRKGIIQGVLLLLSAFVIVPALAILGAWDNLIGATTIFTLMGGLLRIIYALFQSKHPAGNVSPKRKGIGQGVVLLLAALPAGALIVNLFNTPRLMAIVILFMLAGGIIRLIYALFFQSSQIDGRDEDPSRR
ncbi:MAG: serine/threonine protein kinase [Acidobacteria bacterium]|nr:serine/threonine protein kinase [Acidobacteriota bacterium]